MFEFADSKWIYTCKPEIDTLSQLHDSDLVIALNVSFLYSRPMSNHFALPRPCQVHPQSELQCGAHIQRRIRRATKGSSGRRNAMCTFRG